MNVEEQDDAVQVDMELTDVPVVGKEWAPRPFVPDRLTLHLSRDGDGWVFHRVSISGEVTEEPPVESLRRMHLRWYVQPTEETAPAWLVILTEAQIDHFAGPADDVD